MKSSLSRRDFIKLMGVGALGSILPVRHSSRYPMVGIGRVTADTISVYEEPSDKSQILFPHQRDDILNLYQEIKSESGPAYNPIWYRIWGGYVHSAFIQKVNYRLNPIVTDIPTQGSLAEVTVPISQSYRLRPKGKWERFYKLYYSSTHWVFSVREGRDGQPWYEIRDGLIALSYYIPATHMHFVTEEQLAPISPNVDPTLKKIVVSIDEQTMTAYEGTQIVKQTQVSTGIPGLNPDPSQIPTYTPRGLFHIYAQRPSVHMGGGTLNTSTDAYEFPGVPWVSYFVNTIGAAFHGCYWHNNFGVTMSHGCVNMRSEDANWVYRWATSLDAKPGGGYPTPVKVS